MLELSYQLIINFILFFFPPQTERHQNISPDELKRQFLQEVKTLAKYVQFRQIVVATFISL